MSAAAFAGWIRWMRRALALSDLLNDAFFSLGEINGNAPRSSTRVDIMRIYSLSRREGFRTM